MNRRPDLAVLSPLFVLIGVSLVFSFTDTDLMISHWFYREGRFDISNPGLLWLYRYGAVPGILLGVAGFSSIVAGLVDVRLRRYRKVGLFLLLFLLLGPGLLVNVGFKGNWGRPRPVEIEQFGGQQEYRPVWEMGEPGQGRSFPSGHASIAYALFAPFFVFWSARWRGWALGFLTLGLAYGTLMGVARVAQGAHFASDVLWSAGFVYATGLVLYYVFRLDRSVWWEE